MNYRLSCATSKKYNKVGYVVESNGIQLCASVYSFSGNNPKTNLLDVITKGLRACKPLVKHEDKLYIEVPNIYVYEWLSGRKEFKSYSSELDEVLNVLESIDCTYEFLHIKEPYADTYIKSCEKDSIKGKGISEVMKEFN